MKAVIFVLVALSLSVVQSAATTIDFETLPSLPVQPNNFAAAGAMQTYNLPGVFTISGGVVLGNPTFLAAFPTHGSPPNLYGSADIADPSLLSTIALTFPSGEHIGSVTGVLFNGRPVPETYEVDAFSGAALVASQTFTNMAADNSSSGFGNFSLASIAANPITQVTVRTPNAGTNGWDFFVDTITITPAVTGVPEPGTFLLFGSSFACFIAARRWRHGRK